MHETLRQALLGTVLPTLNENGDLPPGVHRAGLDEIEQRFGSATAARTEAMLTLKQIHDLAARTGRVASTYVFGSFVSLADEPRDVDIFLLMAADFAVELSPWESRALFSHATAQARYRASVFWARKSMVTGNVLQEFLLALQTKRDGKLRGILEIA